MYRRRSRALLNCQAGYGTRGPDRAPVSPMLGSVFVPHWGRGSSNGTLPRPQGCAPWPGMCRCSASPRPHPIIFFFFFTVSSLSLLGNILEFGDLRLK